MIRPYSEIEYPPKRRGEMTQEEFIAELKRAVEEDENGFLKAGK